MFRSLISRAYSISCVEIAEFEKLSIKDIAKVLRLDDSYLKTINSTVYRHGTNPQQLDCTVTFNTNSSSPFKHDEDMVQEAMREVKKASNLLKRHGISCNYNDLYDYSSFHEKYFLDHDRKLTLSFSVDTKFMNLVSDINISHKFQ